MPLVDMQELRRKIQENKTAIVDYYKHQPTQLRSFKWPAQASTFYSSCGDVLNSNEECVWVAVYPEVGESFTTLVKKETCVEEAAKICAFLNPNKSLLYGIDSDFSYKIDDNHHIHFICNEEGRLGGFKRNEQVSQMLAFKLDFDKRVTGRPTNETVYGPVVVCLVHEEEVEIEDEDDVIEDVVSTPLDVTKFKLGDVLVDWCNAWFNYQAKRLYP